MRIVHCAKNGKRNGRKCHEIAKRFKEPACKSGSCLSEDLPSFCFLLILGSLLYLIFFLFNFFNFTSFLLFFFLPFLNSLISSFLCFLYHSFFCPSPFPSFFFFFFHFLFCLGRCFLTSGPPSRLNLHSRHSTHE